MQRRAYAPTAALAAALLTTALAGCGGGSGAHGGADDPKPGTGDSAAPAAEPGKYHNLPEPCGYINRDTLRKLLPPEDGLSEQDAERLYKGQATVTYDTDRRVGCRWKQETPDATRHLAIDFERVVSYQSGVSDDDRAQQLYQQLASAAHIPAASATPSAPAPSTAKSADPKSGDAKGGGKNAPKPTGTADHTVDPATTPPPSGGPDLAPRTLDDLGDDAFIDDKPSSDSGGVHRDVTIVFRSANVLVTIAYDEWPADKRRLPASQDVQHKAHALAREIDAGHFGN
ncbi:hypothetical protein [Streptomyces orinoci]|uniref:DUF3558 domain-containing protein n=1 Tax=Streptomyces orinoci TaxID=67339 RepID=A0ABV3K7G2_STRON|nr:hypothetical protein [Streptomyces orinoci]